MLFFVNIYKVMNLSRILVAVKVRLSQAGHNACGNVLNNKLFTFESQNCFKNSFNLNNFKLKFNRRVEAFKVLSCISVVLSTIAHCFIELNYWQQL